MLNQNGENSTENPPDMWKPQQKDHPEVCIPTNPGTLLHPGSCTPCAFVFRVAEGQVRNRCTNGDQCGWCHHPSHPRTRGRRQKNGGAAARQKEAQQQEAWTDRNGSGGNGSETSTRDSWSDRETKEKKKSTWTEGEDRQKTNRSTKDERRENGKSTRAGRDERANDRGKGKGQRNDRDDRSKNHRNPPPPEKVERCSTPEFDEQYSCYPRPHHPQGLTGVVLQENCYAQPTPVLYSCVPVNIAVPAQAAEGMGEWAGYSQPTYVPDWNAAQYQQDVRPYAPQQYMMVPMHQPQPHWPNQMRSPQGDGQDRSRESA
jgi:hypothetical protein